MANLYELSSGLKNLDFMLDNLEECEKDTEDYKEQVQCILDTIESVEFEYEEKVENYIKLIRNREAEIETINNEIKRFQARKKQKENQIKWLKSNLEYSMETTGKKKIQTPLFDVRMAKSGVRSIELLRDTEHLPDEFKKATWKADLTAIKKYFKDNEIEECEFAKLLPAKESLRIKIGAVKSE